MTAADQKRRARRDSAFVELVPIGFLIERDGGICQLCRLPVSLASRAPDPASPTLDHVVPLSRGGEHSKANAQLAHYGCNSAKGNRRDWMPA
jgi:5-methylcytosine-specific restriction endonuclease McrA